jgi:hypothetical protein
MATGVFGLRKVYIKQNENIDNRNFASWPESATYGYYVGGFFPGGNVCVISRLDFSNETVSDPGKNLPTARAYLTAVSSSSYGYFGGGATPTPAVICTITRLDFSNETVSDPGKNLPQININFAAISSSSYGYYGGGGSPISAYLSTITRLDFSSETLSNPGKNLPAARNNLAVTSSSSYGYFGGGFDLSIRLCVISRLDFSNETVSDPGKNLPTSRETLAATSSNSYGYFGGGFQSPLKICTITRLDFSNETVSDPGKNLPTSRERLAATSNNSYGYFGGGDNPTPSNISTITRLDFSNETLSDSPTRNLPSVRSSFATLSGGQSIDRGSKTYGYYGGGNNLTGLYSTIIRLDFSNETVSNPGKNLLTARSQLAATSSNYCGYYAGGSTSPPTTTVSIISRLDFSNETLFDNPGLNLPVATSSLSATSSNSYGYFAGGTLGPANATTTTISRLDFSNETVNLPGKNFTDLTGGRRSYLTATSSVSYGYFAGGQTTPPLSPTATFFDTISKFDFSNETVDTFYRNLPTTRSSLAQVSNSLYGYFGGGSAPAQAPPAINTITRLDFSNETVSNPGKNLPTPRSNLTATSSSFYGYFGGGFTPPHNNTITRLDFSNEIVSNPGNNFLDTKSNWAAVSNSN